MKLQFSLAMLLVCMTVLAVVCRLTHYPSLIVCWPVNEVACEPQRFC